MPLTTVCYIKSRCGSTTTALGLAAWRPQATRPVLIECDPAGGDLTLRHGLRSASPGLVDLATATRTRITGALDGDSGDVLLRHAQAIPVRDRAVQVVLAP